MMDFIPPSKLNIPAVFNQNKQGLEWRKTGKKFYPQILSSFKMFLLKQNCVDAFFDFFFV
jgi:hypothetical protein